MFNQTRMFGAAAIAVATAAGACSADGDETNSSETADALQGGASGTANLRSQFQRRFRQHRDAGAVGIGGAQNGGSSGSGESTSAEPGTGASSGSADACGTRGQFCNSSTPCCSPLACRRNDSQSCSCADLTSGGDGIAACDSSGVAAGGTAASGVCRAQGQSCLLPDMPCCAPLRCTTDGFALTCNP